MNLFEFTNIILEYKSDITLANYKDKLKQIELNLKPGQTLKQIEDIDPTKNKQYVIWLLKQFIDKKFRLEDANRINELLINYIKLKNKLPLEQRDIGRFDLYKLDNLIDSYLDIDLNKKQEVPSGKNIPLNTKVLYDGPLGLLAIPETQDASCALGSGTKWCTAANKDNKFNNYKGPLYIWIDKNGEKYQFEFNTMQFTDSKDQPIDEQLLKYFVNKNPVLSKLFKENEDEVLSSKKSWSMLWWAVYVIGGRWPEAEPHIMKDPQYAYAYANDIIHDRWPEAEPHIMKNPYNAYLYAKDVIKNKWPEAEPYIMKDPQYAYAYANGIIHDRWPEAEPYIKKYPQYAYIYAIDVIKGRWPEAEPH